MGFLSKETPALLGLDISSTAIKLIELSQRGGRYRIESYAVEALQPGSIVDKTIIDATAVAASIRTAVKRSRTRAKHAAIAVAGSAVITKIISMPAALNDADMASQIELDANQYIPYPLEEVNLDFQILGPTERDPTLVDVLLAASRSEYVDVRVAAVELAGLTPSIVDIEAYATETALQRMSRRKSGNELDGLVAIIDMGATTTSFTVMEKQRVIYTREQTFGGKQLTEEIQRRYKLTYEEAGRAKKAGGLPAEYVTEVLEPFKQSIAQQVTRSLQFFFSSSHYHKVDHVILAGGNASISGLADLIQSRTETPTTVANPFAGMTVSSRINAQVLKADAPTFMVACGLAMRSFDTVSTRL